jgi:2-phosphosulfolactate phosphatase
MQPSLEVTFTPADFETLRLRDLSRSVCVVFDVLRATSSMTVALARGASRIFPVTRIEEALALKARHPDALLAGERHGVKILSAQTGGVDFDFGNSPREFLTDKIRGKTLITSTTNGTRALQACHGASRVFAASLLNLGATLRALQSMSPANLILVAAGTFEEAALEDTLAAGAVCDALWSRFAEADIVDSARIAREIYLHNRHDVAAALSQARNGRRLLEKPDLRDDVAFCAQRDLYDFAAELRDGAVTIAS